MKGIAVWIRSRCNPVQLLWTAAGARYFTGARDSDRIASDATLNVECVLVYSRGFGERDVTGKWIDDVKCLAQGLESRLDVRFVTQCCNVVRVSHLTGIDQHLVSEVVSSDGSRL